MNLLLLHLSPYAHIDRVHFEIHFYEASHYLRIYNTGFFQSLYAIKQLLLKSLLHRLNLALPYHFLIFPLILKLWSPQKQQASRSGLPWQFSLKNFPIYFFRSLYDTLLDEIESHRYLHHQCDKLHLLRP